MDPNAHVWIFHNAIQANGKKNDDDIVNLFCFTLHDAISKWGENFMKAHLVYKFDGLEVMSLLGNASWFTLGFTKFLSEIGQFYLMKLFNPLVNRD